MKILIAISAEHPQTLERKSDKCASGTISLTIFKNQINCLPRLMRLDQMDIKIVKGK